MHNKNLNRSIDIYIGKKIKNKYIKGQRLINKLRSAVPLPSKASKMKLKNIPTLNPHKTLTKNTERIQKSLPRAVLPPFAFSAHFFSFLIQKF